jgi:hypothetical protein
MTGVREVTVDDHGGGEGEGDGEGGGGQPTALSMASVFPVTSMPRAVDFVSAVLGMEPTFVDGGRWAQFDLNGARLALASEAESSGAAQVMVKVADVAGVSARLAAAGWQVAGPVAGPHEVRATVTGPDGWTVVVYGPR